MVLFEKAHGTPIAIMNAGYLTAIRTSAASGVATNVLARKNAKTLVIVGAGEQAEFHIQSMLAVRGIEEIQVVGRAIEKVEGFIAEARKQHAGIEFKAMTNVQAAVKGADIVCTVTSSKGTILEGAWIDKGCHVNAVGASIPSMREIDEDMVASASLYVDYRPSAFAQSGDIIEALESGRITKDHVIAELGEVLEGKARGRENDSEITLYRSLGIASQDLICAHYLMDQAKEQGLGTVANIL